MNEQDMPEFADEGKRFHRSPQRPWKAICDYEHHDIVGYNVKSPKAAEPKKHVWPPAIVWLWLVQKAAFAPYTRQDLHGQRISVKRGQLVVSQRTLGNKANWGRKAVREFLDRLQRCGMITIDGTDAQFCFVLDGPEKGPAKGPAMGLITICNYDTYQHGLHSKGPSKRPTKGPQRAQESTPNNIHSSQSHKISDKKDAVIDADRSPVALSASARRAVVKAGQNPDEMQDRINKRLKSGKPVEHPDAYAVASAIAETAAELDVPKEVVSTMVYSEAPALNRQAFKVVSSAEPRSEDHKRQLARTSAPATARSALARTSIIQRATG